MKAAALEVAMRAVDSAAAVTKAADDWAVQPKDAAADAAGSETASQTQPDVQPKLLTKQIGHQPTLAADACSNTSRHRR